MSKKLLRTQKIEDFDGSKYADRCAFDLRRKGFDQRARTNQSRSKTLEKQLRLAALKPRKSMHFSGNFTWFYDKFEASILEDFSVGAVERWKGNRNYKYKRIIFELLNNHRLAEVDRYNDHTNRTHSKPSQSIKSSPRVATVVNVTLKSQSTQPSQNPSGKVD